MASWGDSSGIDIMVDGRQPPLTQPIGVLVAAYSRQHGEAECAQMQRSRLPDTVDPPVTKTRPLFMLVTTPSL